jgi:hypothetical protein
LHQDDFSVRRNYKDDIFYIRMSWGVELWDRLVQIYTKKEIQDLDAVYARYFNRSGSALDLLPKIDPDPVIVSFEGEFSFMS